MAKTDNLIHYLSDVADAIREKEGSTDPINAQDFSERIRAITTKSTEDVQYYKIINGNEPLIEGSSETFDEFISYFLLYFKIISIRSTQFGQIISDVVSRTGSSDLIDESTNQFFEHLISTHDVLGFSIYTGKTAELNTRNNANTVEASFEIGDNLFEYLINFLSGGEASPDDPEYIQMLDMFNAHLVRITREEYYSL